MLWYISRIIKLYLVQLLQNILINRFFLQFRILFLHDIKILWMIDDKIQRCDFKNIFLCVVQCSHHIIELYLRVKRVNHILSIKAECVFYLTWVYSPATNNYFCLQKESHNLSHIVRTCEWSCLLGFSIELVQPKRLPILAG